MQEITDTTGWNELPHRAEPGREQFELELIEVKSGHSWERTQAGEIKFSPMGRHCLGPVCRTCGFTFCIECGVPDAIFMCRFGQPQLTEHSVKGLSGQELVVYHRAQPCMADESSSSQ